jgi:hypothetical protein
MSPMPLILATAFTEKAALAQGGFFTFTARFFSTLPLKSHTTCHFLPPRPSVLIAFLPKPSILQRAVPAGHNESLKVLK